MLLAAYLDESGTHDTSPISIMAGYLGTAEQWGAFDADWKALVHSAGVGHVHAVDLFKRTRAFKGWPAEQVNAFAKQLDGVIARHLQLGFSVIVRDDDYRAIYAEGPKPRRSRLDSKYGVCFRACLAFAPSFIASELRLAGSRQPFLPDRRDLTGVPAYSSKVARYAVVGIVAPHHRGQMGVLVGDGLMPVHPTPSRNRRQRSGVTGSDLSAQQVGQLGEVRRNAPRLVPLARHSAAAKQ
jgi:hypothetical protein